MVLSYSRKYFIEPILFATSTQELAEEICYWLGPNCIKTEMKETPDTFVGTNVRMILKYIISERKCSEQYLVLHGSGIVMDGEAVVFIAKSTTGKTTAVSYMTQNGYAYIDDDSIIIDKHTKMIEVDYAPLHIRKGGMNILRQDFDSIDERCKYIAYSKKPEIEGKYVYIPERVNQSRIPIKSIFFLERDMDYSGVSISPVPIYESIPRLLKSELIESKHDIELMELLKDIGKKCYDVKYAEARELSRKIEKEVWLLESRE